MAQVGVRRFKAELSRYLREVRRGRPVFITDRGEIIAQVSKADGVRGRKGVAATAARLRALEERGQLRPPARADRSWVKGPLVRLKRGTARRLLDADRND
jgi:prevent-host-death family protein